jgi:hypothetical protein
MILLRLLRAIRREIRYIRRRIELRKRDPYVYK